MVRSRIATLALVFVVATACGPASFDLGDPTQICSVKEAVVYSDIVPRYPENARAEVTKVELVGAHDLVLVEASFMGHGLGLDEYPPNELRDYDADLYAEWMSRKSLDEVVLEPGRDEWSIALVVRMAKEVEHAWSENIEVHFRRAGGGGSYVGLTNTELHLVSDESLCESALDDED
jgi:hypothetical protein